MLMIVPGGSNLIDVLTGSGHMINHPSGAGVADVTEAQLEESLEELAAGNIEFVILDDDGPFLQVGGDGDGPYLLQHNPGAVEEMTEVPGGVDRDTARRAMLAYLRGDDTWSAGSEWVPLGVPGERPRREGKRRGLFGRLRGD